MGTDLFTLRDRASRLCAKGKGILASDESTGTIGKRLEKARVENTEENRRAYREVFYTADIGNAISGAIMFKETLLQSAADGTSFVDCLVRQGVLPGIKVDEGLELLEGSSQETVTRGLDSLPQSCQDYVRQGATFAKWRAALRVGEGCPSDRAVAENAQQLASYASICQAQGLVPLVEPEILIDGAHSILESEAVTTRVLQECVAQLWQKGVCLEACLFKPQMVIPGADWAGSKPSSEEIAHRTLDALRRSVPAAVPGIMFLSGGQSEEEATVNLNDLNLVAKKEGRAPWNLSFSYGRALQASVLQLWAEERKSGVASPAPQTMAAALAAANGAATRGQYKGPHPSLTGGQASLRENFRGWRTDVPAP